MKWSIPQRFLLRRWTWRALLPTIALSYLALKSRWPWLPSWSCPIRHLTGIPCPGCYLTRSIVFSLSGDLGSALNHHVLGPPAATVLVIWSIDSLRRGRLVWSNRLNKFWIVFGTSAFLVWGIRLLMQFGFGVRAFPLD